MVIPGPFRMSSRALNCVDGLTRRSGVKEFRLIPGVWEEEIEEIVRRVWVTDLLNRSIVKCLSFLFMTM